MRDDSANKPLAGAHLEPENSAHPPVTTIEDVIVFKMARLIAIAHRIGHGWTEGFGLNLNEWRVMGLTYVHQPLRAGDLAELMLMDKSQLSRVIRALTQKGYLTSAPDKDDARAVALSVSASGQELHHIMLAEAERRSRIFFGGLDGEELLTLERLTTKMTKYGMEIMARMDEDET